MLRTERSPEIVASRDEAVRKMRAAADKNLADAYSPAERQSWAEKTVDIYLRRGLIRIEVA